MRPIDADTLYGIEKLLATSAKSPDAKNLMGQVLFDIQESPTITLDDMRPHGRWIGLEYDGYADGFPVYDLWECSECGEEVSGEDVPETHPFCYGCGAKMDKGDDHEHLV